MVDQSYVFFYSNAFVILSKFYLVSLVFITLILYFVFISTIIMSILDCLLFHWTVYVMVDIMKYDLKWN